MLEGSEVFLLLAGGSDVFLFMFVVGGAEAGGADASGADASGADA